MGKEYSFKSIYTEFSISVSLYGINYIIERHYESLFLIFIGIVIHAWLQLLRLGVTISLEILGGNYVYNGRTNFM